MPYVEVEAGVKVFVQDVDPGNAAATVLFLHGWPLCHSTFEYQFDLLPYRGVRCVGLDFRGYGESDKPWDGYGYDRLSDDVRAVVEAMGLKNVILAGHSMGGAVAIRYMARHDGFAVSRLALLAAAAPSFTQRPGYPYGMTRQQVDMFITNARHDRPQVLSDFAGLFFGHAPSASFLAWFQSLGLKAAGWSTIKGLEALRDEALFEDLGKINVPTGIFHGVLDRVCPYQFAIEMNKGIKNSVVYTFNASGHAVYYDELDRFNMMFLKFISGF